ncbi:MAG TPA: VOC family protein, partial [Phycisphaerae bacterium]|nr:VOC family protein [Phycisphaerae bacterium]
MSVEKIPAGYETVTPYLIIKGAGKAIEFYKKAFGATERGRFDGPDSRVGHAEISIGPSKIMIADECPEIDARSPQSIGGTPVSLYIYVDDVDTIARQAETAGAKILRPVGNQFYGDRSVFLEDPFGHRWGFATHIEDLTTEELNQ